MGNVSKVKLPDGNTYDIKDEISGYLTTETDPTVPEWAKAASKPSYTPAEIGALPDNTFIPTKTSDLINDSDFMSGMTILSYGHSTWQDFITAYTKKHVVYCRASSQSNPATGSQTRLAFMAYVNNADKPTEVEFQYYRSVSTHTASQQGDQVYVYKLNSSGTWTVTVREASVKVAAGTGITGTYSRGTMTLALDGTLPTKTSDLTNDSGFITSSDISTFNHWHYNVSTPSSPSYFIFNAAYATGTQVEMHYNSMFIQVYGEIVLNITIAAGNRIKVGSFSSTFLDLLGETYASHFTGFTYQGKVVEIIVNTWSGANELVIYNPNTSSIASEQHVAFNLFLPIG